MKSPVIAMLCGLPASGKSTYANELAKNMNATVLSSDALRLEMFGDETDQDHNQQVFQELHKRVKEHLRAGKNVIYDSTNISSKRRRSFLEELKKIDCFKECIIIATPYEQCLENNKNRERKVPEWVIERMYRKWQTPHWFEGWNNVDIKYWDDKHFVDEFAIMESLLDFNQDNYHHSLTLGQHLFKTFEICNVECDVNNYNFADSIDILSACLMHDCGKPFVKTFINSKDEITDTAHYYNHEHVSAYESLFIRQDMIKNPIEISALVTWHMQPYFFERENNEKLHNKYKKIWGEKFYNMVMTLHKADKAAH